MADRRIDRTTLAVLALIVAIAAGFRFWALGANSVWVDEGASWFQSSGTFLEVFSRTAQDNYPPLHNLFLWLQIGLFGDGEASLRFPSAVFATLEIPAVFMLGRAMAGSRAGLMAAALLALSPVHLYQAHNARMYTLFSLTVTLWLWSALRHVAMRRPSSAAWAR